MGMISEDAARFVIGTTAMWQAHDEIVPVGVPCLEIKTTNAISWKIGNGIHRWSDLPAQDVVSEFVVGGFIPNHSYSTRSMIIHDGNLRIAKTAFTSGAAFNEINWDKAGDFYTTSQIDQMLAILTPLSTVDKAFIESLNTLATSTSFNLVVSVKNIKTGNTGSQTIQLPFATSSAAGIMPVEAFVQLGANTSAIQALQGRVLRYVGDFSLAQDPNNPTQQELMAIYHAASGLTGNPMDGVSLRNKETDVDWMWFSADEQWISGSSEVPLFQENIAGLIVGSPDNVDHEGMVVATSTGTGRLANWADFSARVRNKVTDVGDPTHSRFRTPITDGKDQFPTGKKILNIEINTDEIPEDIDGIAINGKRMDFDYRSLLLKNSEDETSIVLNETYEITSPHATVECYDKIFIFDEVVPGKGIIRDLKTATITEVTDLGIFAPRSRINLIHVIDQFDNDVAYCITEESQSIVLMVYPDGSYKTVDMVNVNRTPQNIHTIKFLTSVNGKRHSWFMYNCHAMNTNVRTVPTEYILFQIEDCTFEILDNTTPSCTGQAGVFATRNNLGDLEIAWEGCTDQDDYVPASRNQIDCSRGTRVTGNARFRYPTGQWQSERGSVRKDLAIRAQHNGIYNLTLGPKILADYTTGDQHVLVTPEGFMGWFLLGGVSAWGVRDWRETEIKSGPYKGMIGMLFYSIDQRDRCIFIVNTPDGDPTKTVCTSLETSLLNLNHLSGENPIAAGFVSYPTQPLVLGNRIFASWQADASNNRYMPYINVNEITPNTRDPETGVWTRHFDYRILDAVIDTGFATATFNPRGWCFTEHINFDESDLHAKGLWVSSTGYTCTLFIPDAPDGTIEYEDDEGDMIEHNVRPYFIQHPGNIVFTNTFLTRADDLMHWASPHHAKCVWNNRLIVATSDNVRWNLEYFYNKQTRRIASRLIEHTTARAYTPVAIDNKYLLLQNGENAAEATLLRWDENEERGYAIVPFNPPRATNGAIYYIMEPTTQDAIVGIRNTLMCFDVRTARTDYLTIQYTHIDGEDILTWQLFPIPSMIVRQFLVTDDSRLILFPAAATNSIFLMPPMDTATQITLPDSVIIDKIFDISNTQNTNEDPWGAYLLVPSGVTTFFYVLYKNRAFNTFAMIKYFKRSGVSEGLWALPPRDRNGVQVMRFALGSSAGLSGTASSPFCIIERTGLTVQQDQQNGEIPSIMQITNNTWVREFGNVANNEAARVDLAVPAKAFSEPQLTQDGSVRFLANKTQIIYGTNQMGHTEQIIGFNCENPDKPIPVYGYRFKARDTGTNRASELAQGDDVFIEIGEHFTRDSMIHTGFNGYALKLQENYIAHFEDFAPSPNNVFSGGPTATLWRTTGDTALYGLEGFLLVQNKIVSSTITARVPGQYTHEFVYSLTTVREQQPVNIINYGFGALEWVIKPGRILIVQKQMQLLVATWSGNEMGFILDWNQSNEYADFTAAQYTVAFDGSRNFNFARLFVTARFPLFQVWENQIKPGIYWRRNNQEINTYNNNIVPYVQFTEEKMDMVFRSLANENLPDIAPFFDQFMQCKPRGEKITGQNNLYVSRDTFDFATGNAIVGKFYTDEDTGISSYKDIIIPRNNETVQRLVYHNGFMKTAGNVNFWTIDLFTDDVAQEDLVPSSTSVVSFDLSDKIYTFNFDRPNQLAVFSSFDLMLSYHNDDFYHVKLQNLNIGGNNIIQNLSVPSRLRTNDMRANRIFADEIFTTSRYGNVIIP